MRRTGTIDFEFVEFIPPEREPGTLYISIEYATVVHDCLCGCGNKVVTPLHPTSWRLLFDGETVSLNPSVGNWSFPCRSHYVIDRNRIIWAGDMSNEAIARGRLRDRALKDRFFNSSSKVVTELPPGEPATEAASPTPPRSKKKGVLRRFLGL